MNFSQSVFLEDSLIALYNNDSKEPDIKVALIARVISARYMKYLLSAKKIVVDRTNKLDPKIRDLFSPNLSPIIPVGISKINVVIEKSAKITVI